MMAARRHPGALNIQVRRIPLGALQEREAISEPV
jgi:hypothetical protein